MFKLLSGLFNPSRHKGHNQIAAVPMRVSVRGKYDAAQTTADNRRHWANADSLSAEAANSLAVRRILRNRARYEVANNCYARGIVDTLANDVIGYGPTIQIRTGYREFDRKIKKAFDRWAKEVRLAAKLRTMRKAKAVDGEAFAVLTTNPKLKSPIKLDIRLIEADQVTDPDISANYADGIRFDDAGNPVSYTILPEHPGTTITKSFGKITPTPASAVIHWFSADRPGQVRGVPDIMPGLPLFAQMRRYTLAVVAAAETAADFSAISYTDAPANGEAEEMDPFLPIEIEQRAMLTLPSGWKMEQLRAEQPTSTYKEFKAELINEFARCVNMPYNIAACNSSSYNYSSGQLDHQTYFAACEVDQDDVELIVLDRILMAWLEEAALIPDMLPPVPYDDWAGEVTYLWRSRGHVDETKMAKAQETRLANNTTTLADEFARDGYDWEEQIRQRAKELELIAELMPQQAAPKRDPADDTDTEDNEDEERDAESKATAA